jgi:predicted enzyme related to lactoylglutathione lyase/uncharacterized protein YciI
MKRLFIAMLALCLLCTGMSHVARAEDSDRMYFVAYGELDEAAMALPENQAKLAGHIEYMGKLYDEGKLLMGGPMVDGNTGMLIFKAASEDEAKQILAADPAFGGGLIKPIFFHPWFAAFSRPDNHKFTTEEMAAVMANMNQGSHGEAATEGHADAAGGESGDMQMTPGAVSFIQIPSADPAKSGDFYKNLFGWEIMADPDHGITFFTAPGGMMGEFATMLKPAAAMTGPCFFINTDSVKSKLTEVEAAGGKIYQQEMALPADWGHIAICGDVDGNAFGIWSMGE